MLDIIDFVMEEIKKSGYGDKLAAGVVLTGGGAQLRDLDALFKSYTGLDVRIAGPEVPFTEESREIAGTPDMATAAGILAKAIAEGKPSKVQKARPVAQANVSGGDSTGTYGTTRSVGGAGKINDLYRRGAAGAAARTENERTVAADDYADVPEEPVRRKKPGFFSKLKEKVTNMFDEVIDDNEI